MNEGGNIIRNVSGLSTKEAEAINVQATKGNYGITSPKEVNVNGKDGGKKLGDYQAKTEEYKHPKSEPKETTKVKEVTLKTSLDLCSANDGNGGLEKGMVHGQTYEFNATYTDGDPKDKSSTKWMLKYHDLSKNDWVEKTLKTTGDTLRLLANEEEMCGCFIYVHAYIEDSKNEGELKVWKHNRFKWLDRKTITDEIALRAGVSKKGTDQGGSSLCGIALAGYYLARDQPKVYTDFVLDMHRTGIAIIKSNKYKVEIDKDEHLTEYKPIDSTYPKDSNQVDKMLTADFVFLATIKDFLNVVFDYDPDGQNAGGMVEGSTGFTLPNEVATIFKNISNYSDVINDTNLATSKWQSVSNSSKQLKEKLNQGYKIGIFINSTNFSQNTKPTFTIPNHWVGLIDITHNDKTEEVTLTVFTWGSVVNWTVSYHIFKDGYFGFVAGK
jgi:hypothetical protein